MAMRAHISGALDAPLGPPRFPWESGDGGLQLGIPQIDLAAGGTFTRASSGGYHPTTLADYAHVANDVRRFENRSPADAEGAELLLEKSATNQCLRSEELSSVTWVKTNATIVADATAAPDGVSDADALVATLGAIAATCSQPAAAITTGSATFSVWAKKRTASQTCSITISDGTTSASLDFAPTVEWARYSVTLANAVAAVAPVMRPHAAAGTPSASDDVYFWGAQVEVGLYPSSYIVAAGAAATRAADSLVYAAGAYPERLRSGRSMYRVCPRFVLADLAVNDGRVIWSHEASGQNFSRIWNSAGTLKAQMFIGGVDRINRTITLAQRHQWLSLTYDASAGTMTILGATTGDGTYSTGGSWSISPSLPLRVGGLVGGTPGAYATEIDGRVQAPVSA